jgi:LPS O-antigen subunit length determinant protein (WzzB/FepE family)
VEPLRGQLIPYAVDYPRDEISLIDLFVVLARHRHLMALTFVAVVALGLAVAFAKPQSYAYTSSLQIARGASGPVEAPATVTAKLNESYIPYTLQQEESRNGFASIRLDASVSQNSDVVVMKSSGPLAEEERHLALHRAVAERLMQDHERELANARSLLQSEISRVNAQFTRLQGEQELIRSRTARLDEQETLLQKQLADVAANITATAGARDELLARPGSESRTMSLVFLDSELTRLREREAMLSEQLLNGINAQRDNLKARELDNLRQQMDMGEKLVQFNLRLEGMRATQGITPPLRSLQPVGTGKALILAVALVAGLVLAVLAACLAEFTTRARSRLETEQVQ